MLKIGAVRLQQHECPRDYHTKWNKSKNDKYFYGLHMESKKNDTNELDYEREIGSQA